MKNYHWLMIICCVVPFALIALLGIGGNKGGSDYLYLLMVLICPLMMLLGHRSGDKKEATKNDKKTHSGCH